MKGRGRGPSVHKDQIGAHCGGVFKELANACPTAGIRMIFHTLSSTSADEDLEKTGCTEHIHLFNGIYSGKSTTTVRPKSRGGSHNVPLSLSNYTS